MGGVSRDLKVHAKHALQVAEIQAGNLVLTVLDRRGLAGPCEFE
jgi:hypothetical protein